MTTTPFDLAREHVATLGLLDGPYFQRLGDPAALAWFCETQQQFGFAVACWPRALAQLAARIPDSRRRWPIVRNLLDEHGDGDAEAFHTSTFGELLRRLGARPATPGVAVDAFDAALFGLCADPEVPIPVAAAALGTIELMFSGISEAIATRVVAHGWLDAGRVVHYDLHAALDIDHAQDLLGICEGADTADVRRGIALGAHVFCGLYHALAGAEVRV